MASSFSCVGPRRPRSSGQPGVTGRPAAHVRRLERDLSHPGQPGLDGVRHLGRQSGRAQAERALHDGEQGEALANAGAMKPEEYDLFVRDIVNFLDYAGEPVKDKRQSMGIFEKCGSA